VALYARREPTHREHAGEIQRVYGYGDFSEAEDELRSSPEPADARQQRVFAEQQSGWRRLPLGGDPGGSLPDIRREQGQQRERKDDSSQARRRRLRGSDSAIASTPACAARPRILKVLRFRAFWLWAFHPTQL
jgi:hypothetical protein